MCVYQAEPHQGFDKHVCPRIEKDSGRVGYRINILGQEELLMHVRKKGKGKRNPSELQSPRKLSPQETFKVKIDEAPSICNIL